MPSLQLYGREIFLCFVTREESLCLVSLKIWGGTAKNPNGAGGNSQLRQERALTVTFSATPQSNLLFIFDCPRMFYAAFCIWFGYLMWWDSEA